MWFYGTTEYLQDNGVRIWNEWADENGDGRCMDTVGSGPSGAMFNKTN